MKKNTGRFITFEGPEGSGKTLQIKLLAGEFDRRGIPFTTTREPGGTAFGKEVREILLKNSGATREPVSELLLYLADRYQHIHEVVQPALERDEIVISDRYHDATLAYQGYARGVDMELIGQFFDRLELLVPDTIIVFDIDVEIALARARSRNLTSDQNHMGKFEAEEIDFHRKVREGYLDLASKNPDRYSVVNGSGTPEEVHKRIMEALEPF
ncbi:MAG: dTMP kinase [Acidobacteriota bacterium]